MMKLYVNLSTLDKNILKICNIPQTNIDEFIQKQRYYGLIRRIDNKIVIFESLDIEEFNKVSKGVNNYIKNVKNREKINNKDIFLRHEFG